MCCGETLEQREQGVTMDFIRQQVKVGFQNVTADQAKTAVIAYEPIWAIGTGKTATTEQAQEVCKAIRECIAEVYDEATAEAIRIQYGGSVNAATAPELFAQPDIDGGLVGGASLKPDFGKIVNCRNSQLIRKCRRQKCLRFSTVKVLTSACKHYIKSCTIFNLKEKSNALRQNEGV